MKATLFVTYKDNKTETFVEGDFWSHQFKCDLEDRNNEFIKVGDDYIKKSEIRSIITKIEKGEAK